MENNKEHWENVFQTKSEKEVSWYQPNPETSIQFFIENNIPKNAKIIEVGGGDSYLIDSLLKLGYTNLTLLDISANAIQRIQSRLGEHSNKVTFVISDILGFQSDQKFDVWHDRASFHFLTEIKDIEKYQKIASKSIVENGYLFLGTFSEKGPQKCSGLPITQYSKEKFEYVFSNDFKLKQCFTINHQTPFDTIQNFIFSVYQKRLKSTLTETIQQISSFEISNERKQVLQPLIDFIQEKTDKKETIRLNFICTHNSRRSHLSQVWAQTMAFHFSVENVFCYSGGTEATALFPKVVETVTKQGFSIQKLSESENPVYSIKYDENEAAIIGFSKKYDDDFNPKSHFAAIMTCSSADEGCPIVLGAEKRFPIRYNDPKLFDNTPEMDAKYEERNLEIASEMYYVFSKINHVCQ